jgi:hypothetical protein
MVNKLIATRLLRLYRVKWVKMGALAAWKLWDYIEASRRQLALRMPM